MDYPTMFWTLLGVDAGLAICLILRYILERNDEIRIAHKINEKFGKKILRTVKS